jgi:hypothetical protein
MPEAVFAVLMVLVLKKNRLPNPAAGRDVDSS